MSNLFKRVMYLGVKIMTYYRSLGVNMRITRVKIISHLQRYIFEVELLPGTKVQSVFSSAPDVQSALKLHLFYPFRKETSFFIAVSEFDIKKNGLLDILNSQEFSNSEYQIPIALGYDLMGDFYLIDLAKILHLLIIGPSGTGKSVALQCIVLSIIVKCSVDSVRLILFDIGANSLSCFINEMHLYSPIVKDTETGIIVLESLVAEMEKRLSYPEHECQGFPYIVCVIDEFDDTVANIENKEDSKRFIASINSIIRRGRKAKVVLILASHDSALKNTHVNVSGIVSRIAFQCANHYNSSTALGITGAQNLPGNGAMLFKSQDICNPIPLQGSYVTSVEIERVLDSKTDVNSDINMLEIKNTEIPDKLVIGNTPANNGKKELADILMWALGHEAISKLQIQKKFRIGNRASEIMDALYQMNVITEKYSNQPRKVIPVCIGDISSEALDLLNRCDYTTAEIEDAFKNKTEE